MRLRASNSYALCMVVLISHACLSRAAETNDEVGKLLLADAQLNLYYAEPMACGPVSLYHALASLGHEPVLEDILRHVPITRRGSSLGDLSEYLRRHEVEHSIIRTDRLAPLVGSISGRNRCLILLVDGSSHFVTVAASAQGVPVLMDGTKAESVALGDGLDSRFSGVLMVVGDAARSSAGMSLLPVPILVSVLFAAVGLFLGSYGAARFAGVRREAHQAHLGKGGRS